MNSRLLRTSVSLACILSLALATAPTRATEGPTGHALAEFLDENGRICMDALLASGYEGPVDLRGHQVYGSVPVNEETFERIEALDRSQDRDPNDGRRGQPLTSGNPACWSDQFPLPGLNGGIDATAVYDGMLVVGGSFTIAGKTANYVATWDGSTWSSLGSGMNAGVRALSVYGGDLVAAGDFTIAGGVWANRIAKWNGSNWSPLGQGTSGDVNDLVVWQSDLVATGDFTVAGQVYANRIARWDGTAWFPLGDGLNDDGDLLEVYSGKLVVAGYFSAAGTTIAEKIAAWDGSGWNAMGPGPRNGGIEALVARDGLLIAGGNFEEIGLDQIPYLAAWNGARWIQYGGVIDRPVSGLADLASGLAVAFSDYSPSNSDRAIVLWNGVAWTTLLELEDAASINLITEYMGDLLISVWADSNELVVATWDGANWTLQRGPGIDGSVEAVVEYQGDLVIGGSFTRAGAITAAGVARWNGTSWDSLGGGIGGDEEAAVQAMEVSGSDLYVGGTFSTAGGDSASNIARWDGAGWSALGTGIRGTSWVSVEAIEEHDGLLYVGGSFRDAGGLSVQNVASWDGVAWDTVGTGAYGVVYDLLSSGTLLIAGGEGGVGVRAWNGGSWLDLGLTSYTLNDYPEIYALALYNGDLIIGGILDPDYYAGGYHHVARWDGADWYPLGTGVVAGNNFGGATQVRALSEHDGKLIVGGSFGEAGDVTASNIACWDGAYWSSLEPGIGNGFAGSEVWCLGSWSANLVIGGEFQLAGGVVSANLAMYECTITDVSSGPWLFLHPSTPNPFRGATRIGFDLHRRSLVSLAVYDVAGRLVRRLIHGQEQSPGLQAALWDGRDDQGRSVAPGIYFYRLATDAGSRTGKMVRIR